MNRRNEKAWEYIALGQTCEKSGKLEEAIKHFKRAKEINYKLGDKQIEAQTSEELSSIYCHLAEYQKALDYAKEALTLFKKIGNSVGEANGYQQLGRVYSRLGQFSEAIVYQKKACNIFLRTNEQNHAAIAFCNLGECHNLNGQHQEAIKCCKNALKIAEKIGNMEILPDSFLNIGNAYYKLGKFKEAIEYCEKSLAICTKQKKVMQSAKCEAICYGVMGNAYKDLDQREKAINYYEKSIEINKKLHNYTDMAITSGNLGQYYFEIAQKYFQIGRRTPTSTSFREALLLLISFSDYLQKSIKFLKQAIQIINKLFHDLAVDKNKTSFCERFYHWHVKIMFPFHLTGRDEAALLVLDLGKAKVLRMLLEQQRKTSPTLATGRYRDESWISIEDGREKERLKELSKEIQLKKFDSAVVIYTFDNYHRLIIWIFNHDGSVKKLSWIPDETFSTALEKLHEYISLLLGRVSVRVPREYSFVNQVSPSSELPTKQEKHERVTPHDKAARITTTSTKKSSSGNVSNASSTSENLQPTASENNVRLQEDKQSRAPQHSDENTHQNQMSASNSATPNVEDSTQILCHLYQALIGPVKEVIKGTKLIIVPHDCLFFVPFSSLINENGCYLSEKYQVQITPSVHTLASSMKDEERNEIGISLFVGNPKIGEVNFDGRRAKPSPLPAATKEVENLALLLGAKPLVEVDATKERVIQLMRNATIVHIAAHGDEMNGDIFLAPNSVNAKSDVLPGEETYLLTQSDVLDSKLAARLVVLSCCHSGRGETSSEGVLGIARSFMGAGARAVLVALWRIHDEATQEFMEHFYAKLCQGTFVCKALKETINMFQQHEQYKSFSYWAPFEILGEDVKFTEKEIDQIRIRNSQTFN